MSKYGVTPEGFVIKRLDEIIGETQQDLTEDLGFDVGINEQSFLNVLITNFCDRIARAWELGQQDYFSKYPSTAEGVSLDNAAQFGGITRAGDKRTAYTMLCTGKDGTLIGEGSRIASNTTPKIYFVSMQDFELSREAFNKANIKVVSVADNATYTITINGDAYVYLSKENPSTNDILVGIKAAYEEVWTEEASREFDFTVEEDVLTISCKSERKSNMLSLSENLTTDTVSCLFAFHSEEYGKIVLPEKSITEIVTTIVGFNSCYNLSSPTYGRLRETDIEFRQSYLKKIASRSSSMLESITAAILENVENVQSATAYENSSNATDSYGRPPHSIEVVVDGGEDVEIAAQILKTKAAGIGTHGLVEVDVPDNYGSVIPVRFNRPEPVYVWLKVNITTNPKQAMPPNYEDIIKASIVLDGMEIQAGEDVLTQDFFENIKKKCSGIAYIDISAFSTTDSEVKPEANQYTLKNVIVTQRQKVSITEDRIEVVRDGS